MGLTVKQRVFVEEYLKHFNATKAAINAGYSPKTAYNAGWQNVRKCEIADAISQRLSETAMGADEVIMRLAEHARGDIDSFLQVNPDGDATLDITKPGSNTRLIKKITQRRTTRTMKDTTIEDVSLSLELYDAQAALVQIGKHHKLFVDRTEYTGKDGGPIKIDDNYTDNERAARLLAILRRADESGN